MEISTFRGYYLNFVEISTFRGYNPHFVDIYLLRGYYPHFAEISMFRIYYPHFVGIIYIDQIMSYLALKVCLIFHIYSISEIDWYNCRTGFYMPCSEVFLFLT